MTRTGSARTPTSPPTSTVTVMATCGASPVSVGSVPTRRGRRDRRRRRGGAGRGLLGAHEPRGGAARQVRVEGAEPIGQFSPSGAPGGFGRATSGLGGSDVANGSVAGALTVSPSCQTTEVVLSFGSR